MKKYSVLDTETGGFDANKNALLSVAVVVLDENLEEVERYYTLVKDTPDKVIEDDALKINGLTRREIHEQGVPVQEVMAKVKELIDGTITVFHNAAFDVKFLNARGTNINESIDTMLLSWDVWPYPQKAKLGMVLERMGHSLENAHNSLGDVIGTITVLKDFATKYSNVIPDALTPKKIDFYRKPWDKK